MTLLRNIVTYWKKFWRELKLVGAEKKNLSEGILFEGRRDELNLADGG